jgi:hypothetical protein
MNVIIVSRHSYILNIFLTLSVKVMKNKKFAVDSDKKEILATALKNLKEDELDIFDALVNVNSSPWGGHGGLYAESTGGGYSRVIVRT